MQKYFEFTWREINGDFFEQIVIANNSDKADEIWRTTWPDHLGASYKPPTILEVTEACYLSGKAFFKSGGISPLMHHCTTCGAADKKDNLLLDCEKLYCSDCIGEQRYDDWPCQQIQPTESN